MKIKQKNNGTIDKAVLLLIVAQPSLLLEILVGLATTDDQTVQGSDKRQKAHVIFLSGDMVDTRQGIVR